MSFPKVKEEEVEQETGAFGWTEDAYEEFRRVSQEAREGLEELQGSWRPTQGCLLFPRARSGSPRLGM